MLNYIIRRILFMVPTVVGITFVVVTHDPALAARCDGTLTLQR